MATDVVFTCDSGPHCNAQHIEQPLSVQSESAVRVSYPADWGWGADGVTALCPECLAHAEPRATAATA